MGSSIVSTSTVETYLLNTWYVAAYAHEVTQAPLARTLLEEHVVLFRTETGHATILENRCPHRFAPLALGKVSGETLACGYHGLSFDRVGQCVGNPHGPIPRAARVRAYPAVERYGFVWYWPGQPALADPERIPTLPYLADLERFSIVTGYLHVKANYQLVVDNLLDLSHVPFLHPHFGIRGVSAQEQLAKTTTRVARETDRVTCYRLRSGLPANGPSQELFGFGTEPVDSRSNMTWMPPAILDFDLGSCRCGTAEAEGLCLPAAHCITPETARTCHYFFAQARNLRRGEPEVDQYLLKMLDNAFRLQDEPMIEAVQGCMGETTDLDSLHPLLLRTDAAPVAARQILARLIAAERGAAGGVDVRAADAR
jgi:phenylpropionate dioxygenase-like ring-hydroxylating dioxygenase large terminal subunit